MSDEKVQTNTIASYAKEREIVYISYKSQFFYIKMGFQGF